MEWNEDKELLIRQLKEEAGELKAIMKEKRKRRPIVIEFSGSPKSGKTSSINSLMQFLKRNEIKAAVIQESASICPVSDKHSPLFNLWTVCDSICSLIGMLESKKENYDVIIIDRGLFDAFCWFQWLYQQKKMDSGMKHCIDTFLTMPELDSYIDIVFVFKAKPAASIDREYASLLTDIPGSIMNESVLTQYIEAVDRTVTEYRCIFRKITEIDTTELDQNQVGKWVTEETMSALRELLVEHVGYIEKDHLDLSGFIDKPMIDWNELPGIDSEWKFDLRTTLEKSSDRIQPIPIAVFSDKERGKILCVKKTSTAVSENSPEKDKLLLYVGGHIRKEDKHYGKTTNPLELCKYALKREVKEEIGISVSLDQLVPMLIYVDDCGVSGRHLAVCFMIQVDSSITKLRMTSSELLQNKGTTKSGKFIEINEIVKEKLDTWSRTILRTYFNRDSLQQITIFEK